MSVSAFLSTLRAAGRQHITASTIAVTPATCSHLLRINGYTRVSNMLPNGQRIKSGTFSVGGHDWRIKCYPNGCSDISLFLEHASHAKTGDTTAKFGMSLLPDVTSSKPTLSQTIAEHRFSDSEDGLIWGWRDFIKHEDFDKEKHLRDDCLTVLCDVTVTGPHTDDHVEVVAPDPRVATEPASPPFDMHVQLQEAIWNNREVDVKIEVGGETLPAHRCVLEDQSPVFQSDITFAARSSDSTALLYIKDIDAEVFKDMLRFIYTNSPPVLESSMTAEKMLVAADRYELEELKLICEDALSRHIDMSSVAATLALAERHNCHMLRRACMKFLSSPGNVEACIASDAFGQLKADCPSALFDLVANKMP